MLQWLYNWWWWLLYWWCLMIRVNLVCMIKSENIPTNLVLKGLTQISLFTLSTIPETVAISFSSCTYVPWPLWKIKQQKHCSILMYQDNFWACMLDWIIILDQPHVANVFSNHISRGHNMLWLCINLLGKFSPFIWQSHIDRHSQIINIFNVVIQMFENLVLSIRHIGRVQTKKTGTTKLVPGSSLSLYARTRWNNPAVISQIQNGRRRGKWKLLNGKLQWFC